MSLGVLNNLSAMYAANNLSNTQNSLNKTLQQLSSGSRINSGADDAAGLSLVNGLQANATALSQSQTNATEGVGLLQVADGALSQVTNLLNRAVTLATEVSNGTLNGAQQTAANQEYQSILSEISNIGSTTTYNQRQVFGSSTDIYVGDSSTKGSSIDSLSVSSLSSSNVGDTAGTMGYSSGSNVFINLTEGAAGSVANVGDSLGTAAHTSTLSISYLDSAGATQSATISVGSGTVYANSVSGLMSAINNSGLGISATFGTAAEAGDATATLPTDTGIIISGPVGLGGAPTSAGYHVGIVVPASTNTTGIADQQTSAATAAEAGTMGTSRISYTAGAGENLSNTMLDSQDHAQMALTSLNAAIANVAAQDGYIGAQINTLNSVSSVMNTQQQNIIAAQNAVQATDYAQASSNMAKFQILSQTGISALAQANSMQQLVTKLLQ